MKNYAVDSKIRFVQEIILELWDSRVPAERRGVKVDFFTISNPDSVGVKSRERKLQLFFSSPETSANKSRNSGPVPAIDNNNQIRDHINKRPRHSNHIHIVKVKFNIRGRGSLKKLKKGISLKCLEVIFDNESMAFNIYY